MLRFFQGTLKKTQRRKRRRRSQKRNRRRKILNRTKKTMRRMRKRFLTYMQFSLKKTHLMNVMPRKNTNQYITQMKIVILLQAVQVQVQA